jgi:hypothetical protein
MKKKKPNIPQGAKSAFVRNQPLDLPATEVQIRAEKKGMLISLPYIHNIRSALQKRNKVVLKKGRKPVKGSKAQKERMFMDLALGLGPHRAKALLTKTELALRSTK